MIVNRMNELKICLAQIDARLGDLQSNLTRILERVEMAKGRGADLIAFPELALTGYHTRESTPRVALPRDDPFWQPLLDASREIAIILGFVFAGEDHHYFNAAAVLHRGEFSLIHQKTYLPNYGVYEEGKWFARGHQWQSFKVGAFRIGLLICEESWHLSPAYAYFVQNVDILVILTNSSNQGKTLDDETSAAAMCRLQNRFYARMLNCYVCFVNRVGEEEGMKFWGGSECISPQGETVARAREFAEDVIFCQVEEAVLKRARFATPLRRDENIHEFVHYLKRWQKFS
ncbi:MAG: carbon-nitrogen hydrolase [Calditrichaeota bacterium]|nr:MAG: carbon-nitrogen hydrolase [Calditrichota bacterium]